MKKSKFSFKSDVYSFGMVLWEIFTGKMPYDESRFDEMNPVQFMLHICESKEKPSLVGLEDEIRLLIKDCWNDDPDIRPSFSEILSRLKRMKEPETVEMDEYIGLYQNQLNIN